MSARNRKINADLTRCSHERRGTESQSQLQGGQVAEAEAEANPSIKCQYRGGPTMYAAKQIAIKPRAAFTNLMQKKKKRATTNRKFCSAYGKPNPGKEGEIAF
ncbi:alanine--tRNA ligase [Striga asiatica]|uniref:Alanine--tRNA ligase n=1 Tax=Striga asiatica TaxID=4170 RepID=A0A5A7R9H8_STRAF|nr:alanine--tRNA ligase [Striga asiatica]